MQRGFTLIQISLLLTVVALVLVAVLPSTQAKLNSDSASKKTLETVYLSLRQYEAAYGKLPCPADASQPMGGSSYGRSAANPGPSGSCSGGTPAANFTDASNHVAVGMVPVRALAFSNEYALDGYGRAITYAVDTRATACGWPSNALAGGIAVTDDGRTTGAIAALVSHGSDGHGAWIPLTGSNGSAVRLNAGSTDADQLTNAHVDASFTPLSVLTNFVRKAPTLTFDDLVVYKSPQWNIAILPLASPKSLSIAPPADSCYSTGQMLTFTVNFSAIVTVTGAPRLTLTIGSNTRYATYASGSGTAALTFSYRVQAADSAPSGISMTPLIDLNGGTLMSGSFCLPLGLSAPDLSHVKVNNCIVIYVADVGNNRVEKFDGNGNYLSQFGSTGNGNGQFNLPANIAFDGSGNVWVVDGNNSRVEKFDANGTYLSTPVVFGYGNGAVYYPYGISLGGDGTMWVTDTGHNQLDNYDPSGTILHFFSYNGGSGNGQFSGMGGLAIDANGNFWMPDLYNHRLQKFSGSGSYVTQFGTYGYNPGQFVGPENVAIDAGGNLWVVDSYDCRVEEFDSGGAFVRTFGSCGSGNGQFSAPIGIAIDQTGNIWVTDSNNNRVEKFDSNGNYLSQFGTSGSGNGQFSGLSGIAISSR